MKNLLYYFGGMLLLLFSCKSAQSITTSKTSTEDATLNTRIAQMSIEEKVGQTCQITLDVISQTDAKGATRIPATIDTAKLNEAILKYHVGSVLNVGGYTYFNRDAVFNEGTSNIITLSNSDASVNFGNNS